MDLAVRWVHSQLQTLFQRPVYTDTKADLTRAEWLTSVIVFELGKFFILKTNLVLLDSSHSPDNMEFNWKDVCLANAEINRTTVDICDDCDTDILDAINEHGSDVVILNALEKAVRDGMNPTECLHDYLNTILGDSARYSFDGTVEIKTVIRKCLEYGAEFPYDRLFERRGEDGLEREVADYHVRGFIIDVLKPDVKRYANWAAIVAQSWEEIDHEDSHVPDDIRYAVLKYNSEYLTSLRA